MKRHEKTHARISIGNAITAAFKRIFRRAVGKTEETVSIDSDETGIIQTEQAPGHVEASKRTDTAEPTETSESVEKPKQTDICEITEVSEPTEIVRPIKAAKPTKPRQPRTTQQRNFTPSRVKLARDWFHVGDRVVMLVGPNCGETATILAMTIACDLCQGKAPRVFDLNEEIPRQRVIYYQFNIGRESLRERFLNIEQYAPWLEVIHATSYELKRLIEDVEKRIWREKLKMATIIIDDLDKLSIDGQKKTWETEKKIHEEIDAFRRRMKKKRCWITTIILSKAIRTDDKKHKYWLPVVTSMTRGGHKEMRYVTDALFSLGPTRMGHSVKMIRDCINRNRTPWEGKRVAIVSRCDTYTRGEYMEFKEWSTDRKYLPLTPDERKAIEQIRRRERKKKDDMPIENDMPIEDRERTYPREKVKITDEQVNTFFREYLNAIYGEGKPKYMALEIATQKAFGNKHSPESVAHYLGLKS